ncbi:response regulator [Sphingobium sp.]|uniref:response regulator n=1 Tax=Sphingobium sp. TaxID=1912891 RepID=UPI002C1AEA1D|nr:response regulator [Sphingobium sp.]HUD93180.1 response regulator [Sphingobium sp.]
MQFFRRAIRQQSKAVVKDRTPQRRLRVLLVDEDATARTVFARRLAQRDYDVLLAENGHAALGLLLTQRVDVILLDMSLMLMSAVTTMDKIRAAHLAGSACFVMIGGHQDGQSAIEALKAGADDHIVKPFDFDLLDARLRHLCERAEQMGALSRHNAELDARIARRAVELGETRDTLREVQADRARLVHSIQALQDEISRLQSA